jgi:hypothetical protein
MSYGNSKSIHDLFNDLKRPSLFDDAQQLPPPPSLPTLVTVNGVWAKAREDFMVHVSEADPNAWKGIGRCIAFRRRDAK